MNARIATLRLSLMLVSRVCLGINVFDVNIEREGKENLASISTIRIGNVEFLGFHPPFFILHLFFMVLSSIHCKLFSTDTHA